MSRFRIVIEGTVSTDEEISVSAFSRILRREWYLTPGRMSMYREGKNDLNGKYGKFEVKVTEVK